ncbi:MAG: caspase family protein [Planctomycetaceae bacterium]|jgi:hypothetical protein|nr:caspase family protein [Planctomycetaceae bacterium]
MFRSFISFLCLLSAVCVFNEAYAQKLHLLIAAHGNASGGIDGSVKHDGENICGLFVNNVPADRLDIVKLQPKDFTQDGIFRTIRDLKIEQADKDVIVFYYSGHGAYDETTNAQFLDMGNEQVYRVKILEEIKKRKSRLTVLLTDCCNIKSKYEGRERYGIVERCAPAEVSEVSPLFQNLFFNEGILGTGIVDITSSVKGEFSFCSKDKSGSLFTNVLVNILGAKTEKKLDWKTVTDAITSEVKKEFNKDSAFYTKEADYAFKSIGLPHVQQTTQTVAVFSLSGAAIPPSSVPAAPVNKIRFGVRALPNTGPEGGMKITEVIKGTPAERESVEAGDVFLSINGNDVNTEEEYSKAVDASPQEMKVVLINTRDNRKYTATIKLGW